MQQLLLRRRTLYLCATALLCSLLVPSGAFGRHVLSAHQTLNPGYCLRSLNNQHGLCMQRDGNLVLYFRTSARARWDTKTNGRNGAYLRMQGDGNLVLYASSGAPLWASNTQGRAGAKLYVQNDGNLVIYQGSRAIWSSGTILTALLPHDALLPGQYITSRDNRYRLNMQSDGNLVLYKRSTGTALWATGTVGRGDWVRMQRDGNLVVYRRAFATEATWASKTNGRPGARLILQSDGNLVIYHGSQPVWATNTAGR